MASWSRAGGSTGPPPAPARPAAGRRARRLRRASRARPERSITAGVKHTRPELVAHVEGVDETSGLPGQ